MVGADGLTTSTAAPFVPATTSLAAVEIRQALVADLRRAGSLARHG